MAKHEAFKFSYSFTILLYMSLLCKAIDQEDRKVHIVYMGSLPNDEVYSPLSHHLGMLERVVKGNSAEKVLMRSYGRSFNGFAAKLTDHECEKLADMEGVVSVFPSRTFQLQTTRSWDFMGFSENVTRNDTKESDVIVGVMDTGIWPELESFSDEGYGPAPKQWKGVCEGGQHFTCNNKIIGARFYSSEECARDAVGHGSHTASTAAGNAVEDVSFYGLARGTARGGVPSARIAVYNVCTDAGCSSEDLMAGFDDAIADRVSLVTCSIGTTVAYPLEQDPIAIGAFHAMKKGILTCQSAGNSGPGEGTVSSVAPWILSVAACSIDRRFISKAVLGNGRTLVGLSVNSFTLNGSFPLIYGKNASSQCSEILAGYCEQGCLDSAKVKGKIVLCEQLFGYVEAERAGAIGSILASSLDDVAFVVSQPATALTNQQFDVARSYQNSTTDPRAYILKSEVIQDPSAPHHVASFSSRGPNQIMPEMIKPDICAPGIDIIAGYSPVASVSGSPYDKRSVKYNVLSGTSMSCPHAAGAAAYVKEFHPDWSPAAIKSALMTTAWPMNDTRSSPGEFAYGSGHINPVSAINPGLVYDTSKEDHIKLLCTTLDEDKVRLISGDNRTCPTGSDKGTPKDHNYPSLAANVTATESFTIKFQRSVTNVGLANSTYKASIVTNSTFDIKVVPEVLRFTSLNEQKHYTVTVAGSGLPEGSYVSASLVWSDGTHMARSPVVVRSVAA